MPVPGVIWSPVFNFARGAALLCMVASICLSPQRANAGSRDAQDRPVPLEGTAETSSVLDLEGHVVDPFRSVAGKALVLVFIANDCPISNRYAPELRRLYAKFSSNGVTFWLVHPDADESVEAIRQHAAAYQYPMRILRDPRHVLVRRALAHVTPEAAVFFPNGKLAYHGRIDNRFADFGKDRPEATQHDLEATLEAVLAGRPVPVGSTRAVGCYIPDAN
jgi:hypothetical protein